MVDRLNHANHLPGAMPDGGNVAQPDGSDRWMLHSRSGSTTNQRGLMIAGENRDFSCSATRPAAGGSRPSGRDRRGT